jgi:hypothetical protein
MANKNIDRLQGKDLYDYIKNTKFSTTELIETKRLVNRNIKILQKVLKKDEDTIYQITRLSIIKVALEDRKNK